MPFLTLNKKDIEKKRKYLRTTSWKQHPCGGAFQVMIDEKWPFHPVAVNQPKLSRPLTKDDAAQFKYIGNDNNTGSIYLEELDTRNPYLYNMRKLDVYEWEEHVQFTRKFKDTTMFEKLPDSI